MTQVVRQLSALIEQLDNARTTTDVQLVRGLLIVVTVCVLLAGCGAPPLSQHAASVICLGLAKGGNYQTAADAAAEDGITDPREARTAIRDAVRDHCPAYLGTIGG